MKPNKKAQPMYGKSYIQSNSKAIFRRYVLNVAISIFLLRSQVDSNLIDHIRMGAGCLLIAATARGFGSDNRPIGRTVHGNSLAVRWFHLARGGGCPWRG